ncbi:MAG TPA: YlxR family protein [Anaerolineaceae bacterium]|nr:YlxR family protein [Anaerolineaceae bacterium]
MAKSAGKRIKHIPQRTCAGCHQVLAKRSLIRIVRTADGIQIDPSGKIAGRGAYLHENRSCWEKGLKGSLAHALKTNFSDHDRELLEAFLKNLTEEPSQSA